MSKVPEIRFKGFTDDWEQRELSDITIVNSGRDYKHLGVGEIPVYGTGGLMLFVDKALSSENDAIGIGRKGTIDKPYILKAPFWTVDTLFYVIPNNNIDLYFLYKIFERVNWKAKDESTGVPSLSKLTINKTQVSVTSYEEQVQIGRFFKEIDQTITLHQRKLEQLQQTKKAFLQKMFPKEGETIPAVRFKGFTDDWEQRELGEEALITMGQSPLSENYTSNPDDFILVQGNADMKDGYVFPRVWTTQVTKTAKAGDLILSVRAPVGDVGKTDYAVVLGRGVAGLKGNEFIFQLLGYMKINGYWLKLSTGSTFESINSNDIKNAKILVPNKKEQDKIGYFLSEIDKTITLHQRELKLLKQTKQGFLQKMFPKGE